MLSATSHRKETGCTRIFMVRTKSNSMAGDVDGWKSIEKDIYVSMTLQRPRLLRRDRGDETALLLKKGSHYGKDG
jgi:hypothetical protein